MTKLQHSQIYKTTAFFTVVIAMLVGSSLVRGITLSSNEFIEFSKIRGNVLLNDDTTGIVCPLDISTYTDLNSCDALISSGLEITDLNHVITKLSWIMEGATEGASASTGINQLSTSIFNEGTTIVTYQGKDRYNNSILCSFVVTVVDNQLPRVINPSELINEIANIGDCNAVVKWIKPIVVDNCTPSNQILITSNYSSGSTFPVGNTEVQLTINDGNNSNYTNYSFFVVVSDEELPVLIAPEQITVNCGEGVPSAFTKWSDFQNAGGKASDNCSVNYMSFKYVDQKTSGIFCPYIITRTYRIADENGNISEVKHFIKVEGEEKKIDLEVESEKPQNNLIGLKSGMATYTASQSGNWSDPATWGNSGPPTFSDDVSIQSPYTVTIDAAAECKDITIQSGGTVKYSAVGTQTLQVYGDWINNGTFTPGTSGTVQFTGTSNTTISGTTIFEEVIIDKGNLSTTLTISGSASISSGGSLTLIGGLITIPSGGSFAINPISNITIPEIAGFDVTGGSLTTTGFSITNKGLIRISSGTANLASSTGNEVHTQQDGAFIVTGGVVDIGGRLENTAGGDLTPTIPSGITISGGEITLCTAGNNASGDGSLNVTTDGAFNFTGGKIIFENQSTAGTAIDLGLVDGIGNGAKTTDGGTFQFGNSSTPASSSFNIFSGILLNNITTGGDADITLQSTLILGNPIALNGTSKLFLNDNAIQIPATSAGTYNFPLTDASGNSIPGTVVISGTSFDADAYIELTTFNSKHLNNANTTNYLNRYWLLTTSGITNPSYNVTATYSASDVANAATNLLVGSYASGWSEISGATVGSNAVSFSSTSINLSFTVLEEPTVTITNTNPEVICDGNSVTLNTNATGDPALIYLWTSNPSTTITPNNTSSIDVLPPASPSNSVTNYTYTITVTDGNGFTATDDIDVVVDPVSVGGTIASAATVCSGTNSTTLTLSGYTGIIQNWEYSTNGGANWNNIANTNSTYTATNLIQTTDYRAVVKSGVCSEATSAEVTITVDPVSVGGTIASAATVCSGTNSTTLTLSGYSGTIQNWEYSTNGGANWNNIVNTNSTYTATNLIQTTDYRAVVKSGACSEAISAEVTITVDPVSVGGTIANAATVCSGTNSTTLTLSGYTGIIQNWEYSTNGGANWNNIANTNSTYTATNLIQTRDYRVVVKSGVCSEATSAEVTITVDPVSVGGIMSSAATVCTGTNSTTLTLSGYTGIIQNWEYSTNGGANWNNIANTNSTYTATNLIQTTDYRTVVKSGVCSEATSAEVTITVNPDLTPPTILSDQNICYNTAPNTLVGTAATGGSGSYTYQWQSSPNGTGSWINVGTDNLVYSPSALTATTFYQLEVTDICGTEYSNAIEVNVAPLLDTLSVVVPGIGCNGGAATVTINAMGGTPPYEFTFNGVPDTDGIIPNVTAGTYSWSLTDARSCGPVTGTINIIQPTPLTASIVITDEIDCNGETGEVTLAASGGTPPYEYTFNGVIQAGNGVFTGVMAGLNLAWSVKDANDCAFIAGAPVDMIAPNVLIASAVATDVLCNGENTGSIELTVTGGTLPYSFVWDNGAGTGEDPSGIVANTYTVTITDAEGCATTATATVDEPAELTASVDKTPILCNGDLSDIQINAGGGFGTLTYTYQGQTFNQTGTFNNIQADIYTWSVTDENSCVVNGIDTVIQPPQLQITLISAVDDEICEGEDIVLSSLAAGGTEPLTYKWEYPNGDIVNNAPSPTILGADITSDGTYELTITDANSCSTDTLIPIIVHPSPTVDSITDINECHDVLVGSITITGSNADAYDWVIDIDSIWDITSNGSGNIPAFTTNNGGNAPVTATVTVTPRYTGQGCSGVPQTFTITVNPKPTLTVTNNAPILCDNGITSIVLSSNVIGTTYSWTGDDGSSGTESIIEENISSNVTYTIRPSANGCDGETVATSVSVISTSYDLEVNPEAVPPEIYCQGEDFSFNFRANSSGSGSMTNYVYYRWFRQIWDEIQWVTGFTWTVDNPNVVATTSGELSLTATVSNPNPLTNLTLTLVNNTDEVQTATISVTPWSYEREQRCEWRFMRGTSCNSWSLWDQQCAGDAYEIPITVYPFAIECPTDYDVFTDPGDCDSTFTPTAPTLFCEPSASSLSWNTVNGSTTDSGNGNISNYDFLTGTTTVTYRVEENPSNYKECSFDVTVTDNEAPAVTNCPTDITQAMSAYVCGDTVLFTEPEFNDNCDGDITALAIRTDGTGLNSGDVFPVGTTTLTWYAVDAAGNEATCSFDVTILPDANGPDINCVAHQAECAAAGSSYTKVGIDWDATATDNCPGVIDLIYDLTGVSSGTGTSLNNVQFDVGTTIVTWTATDVSGISSQCSFNLVITQAPDFVLDPMDETTCLYGSATFIASASGTPIPTYQWRFEGGDILGANDTFLTLTNVQPSNLGNYHVVATNSCGTATSATAFLTVSTPPVISTQPASQTDCVGGSVEFTVAVTGGETPYSYGWQMRTSAADAWANASTITNISVTDDILLVSNIGDTNNPDQAQYRSIVTDNCMNSDTSVVATLTITQITTSGIDSVTVCQDGAATFSVVTLGSVPAAYQWQLEGSAISDNAVYSGTTTQTLTITNAQVSEGGTYSVQVTFNITQPNNNGAGATTCTSSFVDIGELIVDEGPAIVADISSQTICPGDAIAEITLSNANGTPGTTYSWTRNNPVLTGMPDHGEGSAINGKLSSPPETMATMLTTTFTITATTPNGCFSSSTITVTVGDTIAPTIFSCPTTDITVNTTPGNCNTNVTYQTPTFVDNCDVNVLQGTLVEGFASGDAFPIGTTTVKYVYADSAGNVSDTCIFDVNIVDNDPPTALCRDITVQLDASGVASIVADSIDNGSTDGCGLDSLRIDISTFNCTDIAANPILVTLTAVDLYGNDANCTANITVADTVKPTVICQDITVYLNGTGAASLEGTDLDNGSSDNCGIASFTASQNSFDCTAIGSGILVDLTVTDDNDNVNVCTSIVTVADILPPTAVCQDITVQLDASGLATVTANDLNNGSTDNCGIDTMYISQYSFDCTHVGANSVTLTIEDVYGNSDDCTGTVTVEDTEDPVARCQDTTIQLDAAGLASIVAADVDNGSTDNCGIPTLSVIPNNFNCNHLGPNTVTLTATDTYGNDSTCQAIVTVSDSLNPVNITATVLQTDILCNGELADVTISIISGGVGTLTYIFDGVPQATNTFNGIAARTTPYTWRVEDTFSCGDTSGTFEVIEPGALSAIIDASDVSCSPGNDGSITIRSSEGGSGSYEFTIDGSNWQADSVFAGLSPGTFNVQIRDLNADWCVAVLDANLEIFILSADVVSIDISCFGVNEGTITISNPDGGTGSYQFTINGGTNWDDYAGVPYVYSDLFADTFDVRIRDVFDGCVIPLDTVLIITQPDSLFADLDSTNITCFGANNGTISLSASVGGSGVYEYTIDGGLTPWVGSGDFNNLLPGTYDVRIRDLNNPSCERILNGALILSEPAILAATVDSSNITCNGFNDGDIIILNSSGGYGSYEYTIDGGTSWQSDTLFLNLFAGIYDVRIRDVADSTCSITLDPALELSEPPAMTIASQPTDITDCYGELVSFGILPNGGAGTILYEWQRMKPTEIVFKAIPGTETNVFNQATDSLLLLNIGDFDAPDGTQYRVLISDNCFSIISDTVTLTVNEIIAVNPNTVDTEICEGQDYALGVTTSGTVPAAYQWQIDTSGVWVNLSNTSIISGVTTDSLQISGASPDETGQYRVVVSFPSSGTGCDLSSESFVRNLTVHQLPVVDTTADMIVCNGDMVPQINFTGTATTYEWTNDNTGIGLVASETGNIATFPGVNTDTVAVSANIIVTPRGLYCDGIPDTFNITINPTPVAVAPVGVVFCDGTLSDPYPLAGIPYNVVFDIFGGGVIGLSDTSNVTEIPSFMPIAGNAMLTITPKLDGCGGTPVSINILVVESPTATITGGDTVCQGALASGLIFTSPTNYIVEATYTVNGIDTSTVVIPVFTPVPVPVPTNVPGDFEYVLISARYINEPYCLNPNVRDTAQVTVIEPPTPIIKGPNGICALTGGHVYTTEPGMSAYIWNVSVGGTITAGGDSTSNTVTVTWDASGSQNVSVRYTDNNACSATMPSIYPVTVYEVPVPTIIGFGDVCEDDVQDYSTQSGMFNYFWMVSGGTITGGDGTNTVTIVWDSAGVQTLGVNYENVNGCTADSATLSATLRTITVNPEPEVPIAGADTTCSGTEEMYTTEPGMTNYLWTVSSGGFIESGGNFGDNTATVRWNVAGTQSISINYTDSAGCSASADSTLLVTVYQSPEPIISGPDIICSGSSNSVYHTKSGMTAYQWTIVSGDGTINSGANDSVVHVTWNSIGNHTISVDYYNEKNCNAVTPTELEVEAVNEVRPGITGVNNVCEGTTGSYSTESGMLDYNWSVVGGTITAGGDTVSNSVTILWDSAGVQSVSIQYLSIEGCMSIDSAYQVQVDSMPHPIITGETSACLDANIYTYSTEPGMIDYQWIYSAGASVNGGGTAGDDYIEIQWDVLGAQSVSVNYTSPNGCRATSAGTQNIIVNELTPVTCPPDTNFCVNVDLVTLVEGSPNGGWFESDIPGSISGAYFYPGIADVGLHTISYFYENDSSCVSSCTFEIRVDPQPSADDQYVLICSESPVDFNLNDIVADAEFTWIARDSFLNGNSVSITPGEASDTILTDILVNSSEIYPGSSGSQGMIIYEVTATHNGCGGTFNVYVTVEPSILEYEHTWNSNFVEDFIEVCVGAEALSSNDIEIWVPYLNSIIPTNGSYDNYFTWGGNWNPVIKYGPSDEGPWIDAEGHWNTNSSERPYQWVVDLSFNDRLGYHYFVLELTVPGTAATHPETNGEGCKKYSTPAILNIVSSMTIEAGEPDFVCTSSSPNAIPLTGAYVGGLTENPPPRGEWSVAAGDFNPASTTGIGILSSTSLENDPASVTYTPPDNYVGEIILTLTSSNPGGGCEEITDTRIINVVPTGSFEGCLDPLVWNQSGAPGHNGYLDENQSPCAVTIVGSDNGSDNPGSFGIFHCSGEGTLSFDWYFKAPSNEIIWHQEDQKEGSYNGRNMVVAAPGNLSEFDLIIVTIHVNDNTTVTNLSGFTPIPANNNSTNTNVTVASFYKIADGSETILTFGTTGNLSSNDRIYASRVTGHNISTPIGNSSGRLVYTPVPARDYVDVTIPSVNTTLANSMLVSTLAVNVSGTSSDDVEYLNSPHGSTTMYFEDYETTARVAQEIIPGTGATGNQTFSWPSYGTRNRRNTYAAGQIFVINPAIPDVDAAYYFIGPNSVLLGDLNGASGTVSVPVSSGEDLAFVVSTDYNTGGAGELIIYNLDVPNDPPVVSGDTLIEITDCTVTSFDPDTAFRTPNVDDDCLDKSLLTADSITSIVIVNGCNNSQTRSWWYEDDCALVSDTFTQRVSWNITDTIQLTCPANDTLDACIDPADVEAAFIVWKDGFLPPAGGCGIVFDNLNELPVYTDLSCGGQIEFTLMVSDDCGQLDSCTSYFVIREADNLSLTCPADTFLPACSDTSDIRIAYVSWKNTFDYDGGCTTVTTNIDSIPVLPDLSCGGQIEFRYVVNLGSPSCPNSVDCYSIFGVETPVDLEVLVSPDASLPLCSDTASISAAYDIWVAGFDAIGGCDVQTNIDSIPTLPDLSCGGEISFVFRAWNGPDKCVDAASDSSTFSVIVSPPLTITCPSDPNLPGCAGILDITTAYNNWIDSFRVSGGCDVTSNIDLIPPLGDLLCNGQLSFTFIASNGSGVCIGSDTCTATFSVGGADSLMVTCPPDTTVIGCSAADVQDVFDAWIDSFTYVGGCNVSVSDLSIYTPPITCGGTLRVDYVVSDECGQVDSCYAYFSVEAPTLEITVPEDTLMDACQSQLEIDIAYAGWISQFGYTGGCGVLATDTALFSTPDICGGEIIVNYSATDLCGQVKTGSAFFAIDIPINVSLIPSFTVPANTTAYKDAICDADTSIAVTGYPTDLSDNCTQDSLIVVYTDSVVDGSCIGAYVIYRAWSVTDNCHNDTTQVQVIDVTDTIPPVIVCPNDTSELADPTECYKTGFTLGVATATDNCTPDDQIVITNNAPSTIPVGTTLITWIAVDDCGNVDSCIQRVTVIDVIPPVIECDSLTDVTDIADGNCSKISATIPELNYEDSCWPDDSLTVSFTVNGATDTTGFGTVEGVTFYVGTSTVEYVVTDPDGNSDSCSFNVTIIDVTPPGIDCGPLSNVSDTLAPNTCSKDPVNVADPQFHDNCWPDSMLTLTWTMSGATTGNGSGSVADSVFTIGETIVTYTIVDPDGNIGECTFTVTIVGVTDPGISLGCESVSDTLAPNTCSKDPANLFDPEFADNCWPDSMLTLTWTMSGATTGSGSGSVADSLFTIGETTVTYAIVDPDGNNAECTFTVTIVGVTDPALSIGCESVSDTAGINNCYMITGKIEDPAFEDNCWPDSMLTVSFVAVGALDSVGEGSVKGIEFPVGNTHVTYTVTDPDNLTATCEFDVTILHVEIPTANYSCPQDTVWATPNAGFCEAIVPLGALTYDDPCNEIDSVWNESPFRTSEMDASGTYPVGVTNFAWYITDISGNIDSCLVTVIVEDLPPTLVCPPEVDSTADYGQLYNSTVVLQDPTYDDNCPDPVLTWRLIPPVGYETEYNSSELDGIGVYVSPDTFWTGETTIWYKIVDANDNADSCSFIVTVEAAPEIACPPSDTFYVDNSGCTYPFNPGIPEVLAGAAPFDWTWTMEGVNVGTGTTDNADLPDEIGEVDFNQGVTTITWIAKNLSGADTCWHEITVLDTIPPIFTDTVYENCVDPIHYAIYNPNNPSPDYGVGANMEKTPSPDYRTFPSGDISLDLLTLGDNCCDSTDIDIYWEIAFTDVPNPLDDGLTNISHDTIRGTGQPSTYGDDIKLWGDGVDFYEVTHTITYWVVDCNTNESKKSTKTIIITPRPEVIKEDY